MNCQILGISFPNVCRVLNKELSKALLTLFSSIYDCESLFLRINFIKFLN